MTFSGFVVTLLKDQLMILLFDTRYAGTITGIGDVDAVRWPNSYWRSLKVQACQILYWIT